MNTFDQAALVIYNMLDVCGTLVGLSPRPRVGLSSPPKKSLHKRLPLLRNVYTDEHLARFPFPCYSGFKWILGLSWDQLWSHFGDI